MPQRSVADAPLRARLRELAAAYPRWGVPRLHWKLGREGVHVNYKRVERLYRLEGLAVRRRSRKRLAARRRDGSGSSVGEPTNGLVPVLLLCARDLEGREQPLARHSVITIGGRGAKSLIPLAPAPCAQLWRDRQP